MSELITLFALFVLWQALKVLHTTIRCLRDRRD
jgi:hypothetical protein